MKQERFHLKTYDEYPNTNKETPGYTLSLVNSFPDNLSRKRAFERSIEKWQFLVNYLKKNSAKYFMLRESGTDTCGLCVKYYREDCSGCLIFKATGRDACGGTPYEAAAHTLKDPTLIGGAKIDAAKKELSFLKRLYRKLYSKKGA